VTADPAIDARLAGYRASIDNIDAALVHLLAERFKITQAVGEYKAAAGLPAADPAREERQIARLRALAEESGLDPAVHRAVPALHRGRGDPAPQRIAEGGRA
jgi:chorismate mutase